MYNKDNPASHNFMAEFLEFIIKCANLPQIILLLKDSSSVDWKSKRSYL